jgi:neutral trehalase
MNKPKTAKELQSAKRLIAEKSKSFEERLMKSRNAFETIVVLNDMQELIDAEIFSWTNMLEESAEDTENNDDDLIHQASEHVAGLNDFILKLNEQRRVIMPEALKIQRAMMNSHQLKSPIITED